MIINKATTSGETGSVNLNGTWLLQEPNNNNGLRYQKIFTITLPTGGLAEELLIHDTTSFHLKAQCFTFNARDTNTPEKAQVEQYNPTGLLVSLPIPRLISTIRFSNATSSIGKITQLFRTDGDTVSEEPVVSHVNSQAVHAAKAEISKGAAANVSDRIQRKPSIKHEMSQSVGLISDELNVTDGRILVRLKDTDYVPLQTGSITEFNLTTDPENLRVGLRTPSLSDEIFFLPLTFELNQLVIGDEELRKQLTGLLQRLRDKLADQAPTPGPPPQLPSQLELELVIESDAPCYFTISQFTIHYSLARHSLPSGESKQVLRFAHDQPEQQNLGFEIPGPTTLTQATLRLAGDGSSPDPGNTSTASSGLQSSLLELPDEKGLRLDPSHRWSSPLELSEPILSSGLDVLVSALNPNTHLYLEIVADNDGPSGGERLASCDAQLSSPHRPQLLRFTLDTPLLLQPGTYWLMLESREGAAVWRLQPQTNARILPWGENSGEGIAITDLAGIATWVAANGPAAAPQRFPEITVEGQPLPLTLDGNDWVYDMTSSLGTSIAGSGLLSKELSILACGPKSVTIYPPRIEYEL